MESPPIAIDYTDKDFNSIRDAMLRLAEVRLPEWSDRSPSDLGMMLIDLFAHMGDIILYYQDRIASELFPLSATERRSVVDLLRLIGYELRGATPARADLTLSFEDVAAAVVIPRGTRFGAVATEGNVPIDFVYLGADLNLDLQSDQLRAGLDPDGNPIRIYDDLPVEQSIEIGPIVVGSSTAEPSQRFALPQAPVIPESLVLEVDEGAGWIRWDRRESLLFDIGPDGRVIPGDPDARHYQLRTSGEGEPEIAFGPGRRPPAGLNNIRATYRAGGGAGGNVAAGSIRLAQTPLPHLLEITNEEAAAGGSDEERPDHAIETAPLAYRSGNRAVTESDYVALALRTGVVSKARARSEGWNQIDLYVAPAGARCEPVPEALRHHLLGYFEDKRMAGTQVRILDAECALIDISLELTIDERFVVDNVITQVDAAVRSLLDYQQVEFGQTLFQSDVYAAAEETAGVIAVSVTRFRRFDGPVEDPDTLLAEHGLPPLDELPEFLRRSVSREVAPDGRIALDEFEIPALGSLEVRRRVAA